jgi:thiamine pyrophosphate-dependent acetolactate synthase large subunit-like protein
MNKDFRETNNKYINITKQIENYKIIEQNFEKLKKDNNLLLKEKNKNIEIIEKNNEVIEKMNKRINDDRILMKEIQTNQENIFL